MITKKWTRAWHQQQVDDYSAERPIYQIYARVLELMLSQVCQRYASEGHAFARAKDLASFAEKAIRKFDKYPDPIHQFTDLCGARSVLLTQDDADRVALFVKRNFIIDEENSEDIRKRLKPDQFGYRAIHYVVQMPWVGLPGHGVFKEILDRVNGDSHRDLGPFLKRVGDPSGNKLLGAILREGASKCPGGLFGALAQPPPLMDLGGAEMLRQTLDECLEDRRTSDRYRAPIEIVCAIGNRKAEIQVRTLLQHAWSAISHERLYKPNFRPPRELERQLTRVAALLEEGDEQFSRSIVELQEYQLDYGRYLTPEEIEVEMAKWKVVARSEAKNLSVALTIAEFAKAIERWDEIIVVLGPFGGTHDCRVLRLLGLAKCKKDHSGRLPLGQAVEIAPEDPVSLCLLAETYCEGSECCERDQAGKPQSDCQKALSLFARAFGEIAPGKNAAARAPIKDPHAFRRYAECLICSGSCEDLCALAAPALRAAWEMAHRRSEAHVRALESLYDMGFFALLLDWAYDSLGAYARAVFLSPTESLIEAELHALRRLQKAINAARPPAWTRSCLWVVRFLELARVAKLQQLARQAPGKAAQRKRELAARLSELEQREAELKRRTAELQAAVRGSAGAKQPGPGQDEGSPAEEPSELIDEVLNVSQILQDARLRKAAAQEAVGEAKAVVALAEGALEEAEKEIAAAQGKATAALTELQDMNRRTPDSGGKPLPFGLGKDPLVVLAGACDPSVEPLTQSYAETLVEAFEGFSGIICCGGTRAGIGDIASTIQERFKSSLMTIGYLPSLRAGKVEDGVKKDERDLRLIETPGDDFTALAPLQYWSDIIASGAHPHDVKILGINGGTIAALEYRLALAFDASVAVLEKSGREAAKLLQNDNWGVAERLIVLPAEVPVIRAYVRAGSIKAPAGFDVPEAMAKQIHDDYRKLCAAQARRENASLKDWEDLDPDLKDSNFQQARHWADHLRQIGYAVHERGTSESRIAGLKPAEIEKLAELEHARYLVERFLKGWKWGEKRDNEKKINPTLLGWAQLPEVEKEKDREAARGALSLFAQYRLGDLPGAGPPRGLHPLMLAWRGGGLRRPERGL